MYPIGVRPADRELWDAAADLLARTYRTGRHEVAAAIRTSAGAIATGVHLAGSAGRSSLCAEGTALGAVLAGGHSDLATQVDTVLAVLYRPHTDGATLRVIAPCGVCRELLFDYCPAAWIYVHRWPGPRPAERLVRTESPIGFARPVQPADGEALRVRVAKLLPEKNPRRW
jgi:cytidine deaminase